MIYEIEFKPRAIKELKNLPLRDRERIVTMVEDCTITLPET
jgi:mRNA-degrading endonuclease RelE of RelBE toxin-antitoxin system